MTFFCFSSDPFGAATEVHQVDTFVTDGTDTYDVVNKDMEDVGATIQLSNLKYDLYNGGFTKNVDSVTLKDTPPIGLQGVIPGVGTFTVELYDTATVDGVDSPNVKEMSIFFGDVDDIVTKMYLPTAGASGITISFVNLITSGGNPTTSIVQLACCDSSGNALTYQATGTTLYTAELTGFSTLAASSAQSASTITVVSATGTYRFYPGDFIRINPSGLTTEIRRISSISYNTFTLNSPLDYDHLAGEAVYACVREVKAKWTIPENMTNHQAETFLNICPKIDYDEERRT